MSNKPLRLSQTAKKPKSSSNKVKTVTLSSSAPESSRKLRPLTAFAKPPVLDVGSQKKFNAKGKAKAAPSTAPENDQLWVEIYEPTNEEELAVHKKKVEDVRRWFLEAFEGGPSGKLKKYRKILALTGPAGTAKTTTVHVLSRELGFEILEWRNAISENFSRDDILDGDDEHRTYSDQEALFTKFQTFLTRASSCQSIFAKASTRNSPQSQSPPSGSGSSSTGKQVILLEDLPNILHPKTQDQFHAALQTFVGGESSAPLVIIVSDAGTRGEATDERIASNGGGGGSWGKDVVDIRTVLPSGLLHSVYVTQISFNPIAATLLRKAVQALLTRHFSSQSSSAAQQPSKDYLDIIVQSANGDIRSAVMALQFACVVELPSGSGKKGKKTSKDAKVVLEAVTRREQSLALFHLMGKVLYNKRRGDPPGASASAKDIQRDKDLDGGLKDPPPLPAHLKSHQRRASRVDVDTVYADSPIDSSLFSLYLQQNYTQYCDNVDECDGIAEWLSWVDSSGGEAWHQANPHRFHLLTLGTLHSLPTPVPRRSQKMFKPEFFENLKKERDAMDGVEDVQRWLTDVSLGIGLTTKLDDSTWNVGGWSRTQVAVELGGILKARDRVNFSPGPSDPMIAPSTHRSFSSLMFIRAGAAGGSLLAEGDDGADADASLAASVDGELSLGIGRKAGQADENHGGWLENDDIEEF